MYTIEEFDEQKSRIMKYLIYKKRTESEVRTKFSQMMEGELLDDIIEHLKEAGYIDDTNYIAKCINEFAAMSDEQRKKLGQLNQAYYFNNLSIKRCGQLINDILIDELK